MLDRDQNVNIEEQNKQKHGFFQRIKKRYVSEKEEMQEKSAKAAAVEKEEPKAPEGRGVLRISEQSLLYTLWQEWLPTKEDASQGLYLILEKPDEEPVPMDTNSLEAEKQRMAVKLLIEAKKRYRLVHPDEEKAKTPEGEGEKAEEKIPSVIPNIDADAVICISKGAMGAWIMLFPPCGDGKPFDYEDLMEALEAESICYGVDMDKLKQLAEEPVYFTLTLIARGLPEVHGKDGWIEEKYPREMENTFEMDDHGNMDYRSRANMQIVQAGDVICEAFPPTKGTDGIKVTGTVIPATDGKPAKLLGGVNTNLNDERNQLLASREGNLLYRNQCFCVQPLFRVNGDVDYAIGNINFPGDVYIAGDVKNGFVVKAKGSIIIDGLVEGAVLEAGGDISIHKGVLGDARAVIRSQKSVSAQYLENCIVYAGDKVETSSIITSSVYSDNAIIVRRGRGTIIGGRLAATNLISATVIGCRSERVTELVIGEFPMLKQQKEELQNNLQDVEEEEVAADRNIRYLDTYEILEDENKERARAQVLAKLRLQKSVLGMKKEQMLKQLEKLEQKEIDISKCKILCDTIYPTTKVRLGNKWCTIEQRTYRCDIHMKEDELLIY